MSLSAIFQRISVSRGQLRIQGVATCLYLCMDVCGLLYGSVSETVVSNANAKDCVRCFYCYQREHIDKDIFALCQSAMIKNVIQMNNQNIYQIKVCNLMLHKNNIGVSQLFE